MPLTLETIKYVMDQNPDAQGLHDGRVLIHANQRAVDLFGHRNVAELTSRPFIDLVHPDARAQVLARVQQHAERGTLAPPAESRVVLADGQSLEVEVQTSVLQVDDRPLMLLSVRDISDRKNAERALRRQALLFERAQTTASIGVWSERLETPSLPDWSKEVFKIYGLQEDWVYEPLKMKDLIHPEDLEHMLAQRARLLMGAAPFNVDYRIIRPDGTVRWVHGRGELQVTADGQREVMGIVQDITERRALEEQLSQSQKMEAVGRLAGGVAHDFNNLLVVMMGQIELTRRLTAKTAGVSEHLDSLSQAVQSAASLTRQLLTFSRRQIVQPKVLDLREAFAGHVGLLRKLVGETVKLEFVLGNAPIWVRADRAQLDQLVMNLLVNARDAMPEGGTVTLSLEADPATQAAVIRVKDTGHGISENVRAHIFEPFFTTRGAGKGTGLGLSTVYAIVQQANASIEVDSAPEKGATFTVRWPLAPEATKSPPTPIPSKANTGTETILLVEDSHNVRWVLARELRELGYTVIEAENGEQALSLLDGPAHDAKVMVTDMVMPGPSGSRVLEAARKKRPGLLTVLMSGYAEPPTITESLKAPGVRFLQKPFLVHTLAALIRELLHLPGV